MAYKKPKSLDDFIRAMSTYSEDTRNRRIFVSDLVVYLSDTDNTIESQDIGMLINSLIVWMINNNFKVSLSGLEAMSLICDRLRHDFCPYVSTVLPPVIDRLGDQRDSIRVKAQELILKLFERQVMQPQKLFDKLSESFSHNNSKIREEVQRCLVSILQEHGLQYKVLNKLVPKISKLLCDPIPSVSEAAINTLAEIYRHVGDKLRADLQKRKCKPSTKLPQLLAKFDDIKANGLLLPSAVCNDVVDEPDKVEKSTKALKRNVTATLEVKRTPTVRTTQVCNDVVDEPDKVEKSTKALKRNVTATSEVKRTPTVRTTPVCNDVVDEPDKVEKSTKPLKRNVTATLEVKRTPTVRTTPVCNDVVDEPDKVEKSTKALKRNVTATSATKRTPTVRITPVCNDVVDEPDKVEKSTKALKRNVTATSATKRTPTVRITPVCNDVVDEPDKVEKSTKPLKRNVTATSEVKRTPTVRITPVCNDVVDEPDKVEKSTKPLKRNVTATSEVKRTPTVRTKPAGAVDEESFIKSFEDVPSLQISSSREVAYHIKDVIDTLSDTTKTCNKRVEALKKIRSVLIGFGTQEVFIQNLQQLEALLEIAVGDLRYQIVREACATIAFVSQVLGKIFLINNRVLFPAIIKLLQSRTKTITLVGLLCLRHVLTYTHNPRFIPVVAKNATTGIKTNTYYALIYLILQKWPTDALAHELFVLDDSIRKGITSVDSNVRQTSRTLFWAYMEHFPGTAEFMMDSFEPIVRNAVKSMAPKEHMSSSSSSSNLNQVTMGPTAGGSATSSTGEQNTDARTQIKKYCGRVLRPRRLEMKDEL